MQRDFCRRPSFIKWELNQKWLTHCLANHMNNFKATEEDICGTSFFGDVTQNF